jgi:CheY-like chemotaxis protein
MKSRAILVVDDNESNLRLMEALLVAEGYSVKTAVAAEEAISALETFEPDLNPDGSATAGDGRVGTYTIAQA